jgi:WD40 repeat protein
VASPNANASATAGTPVTPPVAPGAGRACPPPLATPFAVVAQGAMPGASELQFSKDGRVAAARSSPLEIQIWNVTSASRVANVVPATPISRWALRPDGRMVAIVSEGRLSLVDVTSRGAPITVAVPANVERVEWRADGKALFVSRGEQTDIVDVAGAVTASIAAAAAPGGISPDGRWLFSREGAMWDVRANQSRWNATAHPSSVAFSDDGQSIAFATNGQAIKVLDAASGNKRWEVSTKGTHGSDLALSADGQSVAVFDNGESGDQGMVGNGMALWYRGKRARLAQSKEAMPLRPTFSPDGKLLAFLASGNGPELKIADARTGARATQAKTVGDLRPEPPRWSADGRTLLSPSTSGLVVIEASKGTRKVVGKSSAEPTGVIYHDAVWSPDDSAILIIADQGARSVATIVDLKTGTARETMDGRAGSPVARRFRSAEWNGATGMIALARADGIALWDGRAKAPLRVIDTGDGEPDDRQIAFSPQGHLLASLASPNKEVRLWDPKTGARVRVLTVPGNGTGDDGASADTAVIEGMAFSADGARIALSSLVTSGSEQSAHIAIVDTANGTILRTLHAPRHNGYGYGKTSGVHFTPQGRGIVSIDGTGHVDLWNTATDDPPTSLIEKATHGPSALADSGNLLLLGTPVLDVWDLRTRTLARQLWGDTTIERARVSKVSGAIAITRVDRVDLHRPSDRASLMVRVTPSQGVAIVADNGVFSGPSSALGQLRVRDGSDLEVRSLRPNEITTLNRPSVALDFVAGCPLAPAQ